MAGQGTRGATAGQGTRGATVEQAAQKAMAEQNFAILSRVAATVEEVREMKEINNQQSLFNQVGKYMEQAGTHTPSRRIRHTIPDQLDTPGTN